MSLEINFVINLLNNETITLRNLAEYCLILADSAYGLVSQVSDDIPRDFAGLLLSISRICYGQTSIIRTFQLSGHFLWYRFFHKY